MAHISLNLNFLLIIIVFYLFFIPITLKKPQHYYLYLMCYLVFLMIGVLSETTIKNSTLFVKISIDNLWFENDIVIGFFEKTTIVINLFLLFPFGTVLPKIFSEITLDKLIIIGFFLSLLIETLQLILPINRTPEVLDLLTNTISIILGYYYHLLTHFLTIKILQRSNI